MTKIYSHTVALQADMVDAFCTLQKGFTDQFVYYDKQKPRRAMGLGRCIALSSLNDADQILQGETQKPPVFFSFTRFDADNPKPADEMMQAFPNLRFMLPELVLLEDETGCYLQVNSLGPVYEGRVARFCRHAQEAPKRTQRAIAFDRIEDEFADWETLMDASLAAIQSGRIDKIVPSRRVQVVAHEPFSSKDVLVNLIDGSARGTVFMYRYGDVFFCGCTPELLVEKQGSTVESMCLAGTTATGATSDETFLLAEQLMADPKNRREHEYVVHFMREVFGRNCYDVEIPQNPCVVELRQLQHLMTPVRAQIMSGRTLPSLVSQLHPTPALAGAPVGEALQCLREVETYNRGFFGGAVGFVDGSGDGSFVVAIRSGVFDGERGWIYAGCGVIEGSRAREEYEETNLKLQTILTAFSGH